MTQHRIGYNILVAYFKVRSHYIHTFLVGGGSPTFEAVVPNVLLPPPFDSTEVPGTPTAGDVPFM